MLWVQWTNDNDGEIITNDDDGEIITNDDDGEIDIVWTFAWISCEYFLFLKLKY